MKVESSADTRLRGTSPVRTAVILVAIIGLLSWISVIPPGSDLSVGTTDDATGGALSEIEDPSGVQSGETATVGAESSAGTGSGSGAAKDASAGIDCAARKNGGNTDTGVTAGKIRLATTVVTSGSGSSFLADAPVGLDAVVSRINNRERGICGRVLELTTVNDSWDAARGRQFIEDFIRQGYFALPVVPSSEGLSAAIDAQVIQKAEIPVVGADGMRKEQYDARGRASWVWPVAVATVSQVRIMAKYAAERGAQTFGIVYDRKYKFGVEGANAYEDYVRDVLKKTLKSRKGIEPSQSTYGSEANDFTKPENCGPCDAVVLLLDPETAKTWMTSAGTAGKGKVLTGGAQPLFNDSFARGCGEVCNGVLLWTGYNPAYGDLLSRPGIDEYVKDVRAVNPSVDVTNQFTQGAYLGMRIFVEAIKKCSPLGLTRACIRQTLDTFDYSSDLTPQLSWRQGNHFANTRARAFSITYSQGSFSGFRDEQTGFVVDPTPGTVPADR